MSVINKIKQKLSSSETKEETEDVILDKVLNSEFTEVGKVEAEQEPTESPLKICITELKQLIESGNNESAISKFAELEIITTGYDKKIQNYKNIIKSQTDFHKNNNKELVEKSKRKTQQLKEKDVTINELKEGLAIYRLIEMKYNKALKELESQQKIIEYNRNQLKRKN